MKILVTPTSFKKEQNIEARKTLERFADEVVYNESGKPLNSEEVSKLLKGIDGYIAGLDYIDKNALSEVNRLKVISRYGTGIDRVDLEAAKEKNIRVTYTPNTNTVAVCELAFSLLLCLARDLTNLDRRVKNGQWPRNIGIELKGKTLGLVGFGAIGKNMAARARAFGMNVIAYDPYFDEDYASEIGVKRKTLKDLIKISDFISLHCPCNNDTKYIIDKKAIASMKDGVIIINTARGGLIDETAVAEAIKAGKISGVGFDVFETEPVTESPLLGLENVILTPHTGAHTKEAISNMGVMAVNNLIDVLEGRDCQNTII